MAWCLVFACCGEAYAGAEAFVWQKQPVLGTLFGGDVYRITKKNTAERSIEFAAEKKITALLGKSPILYETRYISGRIIYPDRVEINAAKLDYETLSDGRRVLIGLEFVYPTDQNDSFGKECLEPVINGTIAAPGGEIIPLPEDVKRSFRGQYGIGSR